MPVHYCLGLKDRSLALLADKLSHRELEDLLRKLTGRNFERVSSVPTHRWAGLRSEYFVARLAFQSHDQARAFRKDLEKSGLGAFGFGTDPRISSLECWSPMGGDGETFSNRDSAEALTRIGALRGSTGSGVNVVIVDRGLDRERLADVTARMRARRKLPPNGPPTPDLLGWAREDAQSWGGPPPVYPGSTRSKHATMIARNVLAIAPEARIWDAPLLPSDDVPDVPPSPGVISSLFHWIKSGVTDGRVQVWDKQGNQSFEDTGDSGWVIVNAWGVFDPEHDPDPEMHSYATDPDHLMVNDVSRIGERIDMVFAAGNCGEPCPDRRCGDDDCGPGKSIYGMNAHPDVLTVGAVRTDGLPIGLSAQGPGRLHVPQDKGDGSEAKRAREKPDLCAPSHFLETDDTGEMNTGTSAACGFAAGIIAALRSTREGRDLPPAEMRQVLRETARRDREGWDPRLGYGIIDAGAALRRLQSDAQRSATAVPPSP